MIRQASGLYSDLYLEPYLIPTDNTVFNESFEDGRNPPGSWIPNSIAATSLTTDAFGSRAIALVLARLPCGPPCDPSQPALVEQQIFIPPQMVNPTLAVAYKLPPAGQARFNAAISDTNSVQVVLTGTTTGAWATAWADLSAWQGMTVNLQLRLENATSEQVLLDQASVASWITAVPRQVSPAHLPANSPSVTITITGMNFIPTPIVTLNNMITLSNVKWISESQLQANLPANLPLGLYDLWITNPGGPESILRLAVQVGQQHYLPMALRSA